VDEEVSLIEDSGKLVIIRTIETDIKVYRTILQKIPFFQVMMNDNWKDKNQEEDGMSVLDLKPIQTEIMNGFKSSNLIELYFIMKQNECAVHDIVTAVWIQLFSLAKYFGDTCIMKKLD